jgi:hypothetical protein
MYSNVSDNPVNDTDLTGLCEIFCFFARPQVVQRPLIQSNRPLEEVTRPVESQVEHHSDPKLMGGERKRKQHEYQKDNTKTC